MSSDGEGQSDPVNEGAKGIVTQESIENNYWQSRYADYRFAEKLSIANV